MSFQMAQQPASHCELAQPVDAAELQDLYHRVSNDYDG